MGLVRYVFLALWEALQELKSFDENGDKSAEAGVLCYRSMCSQDALGGGQETAASQSSHAEVTWRHAEIPHRLYFDIYSRGESWDYFLS